MGRVDSVEPSDVLDTTEVWYYYRENGFVYRRMRDEPLVCDRVMFNVSLSTSAASAVDESHIRPAPRPQGAMSM